MSSVPPIPPPLEHLGPRPFSFYPPILNIEHNEWYFRRATWSEVLVVNAKTGHELWVPRRFLGEISRVDEPVVILGLIKELEFRAGSVWPAQRRVIEMPRTGTDPYPAIRAPEPPVAPASVVGISSEQGAERPIGRLVGAVLVILLVGTVLVISFTRTGTLRPRVDYSAQDTAYLDLEPGDDYFAVVRKLGPPSQDRWRSGSGELQYRVLVYQKKFYSVILMGTQKNNARFIGVMDKDWNPIHYVESAGGGNTLSLLRSLQKF